MKDWTSAYREALETNRVFHVSFSIVTKNSSTISVDDTDIWEDTFKIDGSSSGDADFQIGSCIPEKLTFEIDNRNDKFTGYDFTDAQIIGLTLSLDMGESDYLIPFTIYNATEVTYSGHHINFTCHDNRIKLDKPYSDVGTSYPATLLTIVQDICSACNLTLADTRFTNYEHVVQARPQGNYTCRDIMTMVSQIACSFVTVNRYGQLLFKWYDTEMLGYGEVDLDGGDFSQAQTYAELFEDYTSTDVGMTVVAEGTYDGSAETWTLANLSWFGFNGTYPCRLKVNASSHYQFEPYGETRPDPGTGRDDNTDLIIFDDSNGNASMTRLLGQEIIIGDNQFYKVRFEGYTDKSSKREATRVIYELFILPSGEFYIYTYKEPTAYIGYFVYVMYQFKYNGTVQRAFNGFARSQYRKEAWLKYAPHPTNIGYFDGWAIAGIASLYSTGDMTNGGRVFPWDSWYSGSGGSLLPIYNYGYAFDLECGMEDIVITGIQIPHRNEDNEEDPYLYGEEGYVLKLTDNALIGDDYASVAQDLGARMIGVRFRTFEGEFLNDPTIECGDTVSVIDINGVRHNSPVTARTVTLGMAMNAACNALPAAVNSAVRNTELTRSLIGIEANANRALTSYEQSVWALTNMMTLGFGLFKTEETLEDGSTVYYMHNRPTLSESRTIWKMTADAFAVSTDGGRTWNAGIDSQGNAVVNVLSAVGIVADWIKSGRLTVGGFNGRYGEIVVRDEDGNVRGTIDGDGVDFYNDIDLENNYSSIVSASAEMDRILLRDAYFTQDPFDHNYTTDDTWLSIETNASNPYGSVWFTFVDDGDIYSWSSYFIAHKHILCEAAPGYTPEIDPGSIIIDPDDPTDYDSYYSNSLALVIEAPDEYYASDLRSVFSVFGGDDRLIEIGPDGAYSSKFVMRIYCDTYAVRGTSTFDDVIVNGTKSRVVEDTAYGDRRLYCYETPTPYFGDIGTGRTDENGYCYVSIDSIFAETANTNIEYAVFLQKEGQGDIWVEEKTSAYFVVKGTPNLPFAWELKAVQTGYETYRMEEDSRLRMSEPGEFIDEDYAEPTNFLSNDFNVEEL